MNKKNIAEANNLGKDYCRAPLVQAATHFLAAVGSW